MVLGKHLVQAEPFVYTLQCLAGIICIICALQGYSYKTWLKIYDPTLFYSSIRLKS